MQAGQPGSAVEKVSAPGRWGRLAPGFAKRWLPLVRAVSRPFRPRLERLPAEGPWLPVANHSGVFGIAELTCFAALWLERFGTQRPLGVAPTFVTLVVGTMSRRSADAATRERRMEQALAAHELERQQAATERRERRVVDLLGASHDIKNVISTASLNAASLRKALESSGTPDPALLERMDKVQQALALVVALSRTSREPATAESTPGEPGCSPLRAASVRGVTPALVLTAACDVLRDEGAAYAARLRDEGVEVEHAEYPGALHCLFSMQGLAEGVSAVQQLARWLAPRW